MQKRSIILISVFMTVSLIGVIGLQAFWLKKTIDQASNEFDQRAERALYAAVGNLAQDEMELIITEEIREVIDWRSLVPDSTSSKGPNVLGDVTYYHSIEDDGDADFQIISNGGTVLHVGSSDSVQTGFIQRFELLEREFDVIEEAFKTVIVRGVSAREDLYRRLESLDIEPALTEELQKEGIDLPFVFAVSSDSILPNFSTSLDLEEMDYEVDIFDSQEASPLLHLGFETRGAYILKNTGSMLGLVGLFTLLLMATTIYAIRFMFSQKRLADMKSDFINNMTHEFKTPLATIGLAADSIRHPRVRGNETELDRYSDIITKESKRLNSHVESILHLAKMERGEIKLKRETVRINDLLREAIAANRLRIEQAGAKVTEDYLGDDVECFVDPYHIGNALSNLIDNSLKYSDANPIVHISVKQQSGFILFRVSDRGIGMSEEARKRAFEAFYREQTGNLHDVKGFGVGLSYVKEIAEEHGGAASIESKKGKGTAVTIKIPCNEG